MSTAVPLIDSSADIVSMSFNNSSGQQAVQPSAAQPTPGSVNMLQQNHSYGLAAASQQQPQQQYQQQQQLHFQQMQHIQNLQAQLRAQEQGLQQSQQHTPQQIAMARQTLMMQQQQLAMAAQQHQQQFAMATQQQQQQPSQTLQQHAPLQATPTAPVQSPHVSKPLTGTHTMPPGGPMALPESSSVDSSQRSLGGGTNGTAKAPTPTNGPFPPAQGASMASSSNMSVLRAIAEQFRIPDNVLSQLPPAQLQLFLQNLQAQQAQQARQQLPDVSNGGVQTPLRQNSATPLTPSNQQGAESATRPHSARSNKGGVAGHDRSISQSPAPSHGQQQQQPVSTPAPAQQAQHLHQQGAPQLFLPTAVHSAQTLMPAIAGLPMGLGSVPRTGNTPIGQRKESATSIFADDLRATPTPSDASASNTGASAIQPTYTAEEVANAHKLSEEFVSTLPSYTSESFIQFLQAFNKEHNIPGNFSKPPVFGDQHIDLYHFFCEVVRQGGLEQVHTRRVWRQVAKDSGLPDIPTLPPLLSRWYKVWLQPLEQLRVYPPGHPKHTGISANFSLKKRRKQETFVSPGGTPGPSDRSYSASAELNTKRPKMYSPSVTNGVASANASPNHFSTHIPAGMLQLPPSTMAEGGGMSHSGLQLHGGGTISTPSLPTNGMIPNLAPSRSATQIGMTAGHHHYMAPPPGPAGSGAGAAAGARARVLTNGAAPPTTTPASSITTVTVPPAPAAPPPLRFFPLERTLDTFGGVDLQSCMALRPRPRLPSISECGAVDIRGLTLSIESGIPLEVTAGLNTLIRISSHPDVALPLAQCEELAETLLAILEDLKLTPEAVKIQGEQGEEEPAAASYSEEAALFVAVCTNDPREGGMIGDDMQDESAVRGLLHGSEDLWSFTSDRALTVAYVLRNLTFLPANQTYLAASTDFAHMFTALEAKCAAAVRAARSEESQSKGPLSLIVLRAVEFRKSLIVMLANTADKIDLRLAGDAFLRAALRLIAYFTDGQQTGDVAEEWMHECLPVAPGDPLAATTHAKAMDGRVYYLHALEAAGRLSVSDKNRLFIAATVSPAHFCPLTDACASLLAGHQAAVSLYPAATANFTESRLMWIQMVLVVLSNFACAVTPPALLASRKYTQFRLSPSGAILGQTDGGPTSPTSNASMRRAMTRRPMPFKPVSYVATAVPPEMRELRRALAGNSNLVRSLFEIAFVWWGQIGLPCVRGQSFQSPDSPISDLAERAIYILQLLHLDHDALFAARWSEWLVDRAATCQISPALTEILYELVGLVPVQSLTCTP
ncbi:hypothetical protein H4R26_003532 [Coemansia thaxteri]|uniref:ARID domain-containing protein n=1 Tax=Coemansia thaxteri TaxID=2663907 RepID=A0A9W8BCE9_9FUNG|nr:hypothetical protein H4R26_003532 [Coemansia thaxteri]